jgi:hypothetical protein
VYIRKVQEEAEVQMYILKAAGEVGIAKPGESNIELPSSLVGGQMVGARQGPGKEVDEAMVSHHPKEAQTCL